MDWQTCTNEREKYNLYLASREWSGLKHAVRIRSGGTCERCRHNPMDAVHHLTYIRKYRELPSDLQAICTPCHEFTHAKRDRDPVLDVPIMIASRSIKSIYLAGKIHKKSQDWRPIVNDVLYDSTDSYVTRWPVARSGLLLCDGRSLDYTGPYIKESNDNHGYVPAHCWGEDGQNVPHVNTPFLCRAAIENCDLLFAWIASDDCFGTLAEIGYAAGRGKLILIAGPKPFPQLWFTYHSAWRILFGCTDPYDAINRMILKKAGYGFSDLGQKYDHDRDSHIDFSMRIFNNYPQFGEEGSGDDGDSSCVSADEEES